MDRIERRHLEHFVTVAQEGSIKAAAERLFLTPSGVSKAIADLEAHLGVTLFERSRRGSRLTADGHTVLRSAVQTLRSFHQFSSAVAGLDPIVGTLDIGCAATLAQEPAATLIGAYHRRHPEVRVRLHEPPGPRLQALAETLLTGDYEIALSEQPSSLPVGVLMLPLPAVEYLVLAPPGTTGFDGGTVSLDRVIEIGLVVVPQFESSVVYRQLRALNPRIDGAIAVRTDHRDTFVTMVSAGAGAAFIDKRRAARAVERGCVAARLEGSQPRRIGVLWRDGYLSPAAQALLQVCREMPPDIL